MNQYGRANFITSNRTLPAGDYTVVVYPKWGCNNENSDMDTETYGSLLVDLYYPAAMGKTVL
jgi:hypothetical protein